MPIYDTRWGERTGSLLAHIALLCLIGKDVLIWQDAIPPGPNTCVQRTTCTIVCGTPEGKQHTETLIIQELINKKSKWAFSFLLRNSPKVLSRWFRATRKETVFLFFCKLLSFYPFSFLSSSLYLLSPYRMLGPENAEMNEVTSLPGSL